MEIKYLDAIMTEEANFMQQAVRAFVEDKIMPIRQEIDYDTKHKLIREIFQGLTDLGFQRFNTPEKYGGLGIVETVPICAAVEELARGDSAIAVAASTTGWCIFPAVLAPNEVILEKFAPQVCGDELYIGCFNMTEPAGGCNIENPAMHGKTIKTLAKLDGDEWVINGTKSLASSSGVADLYCVVCTTDPSLGDQGIAMIYVPANLDEKGIPTTPGLSFGKFENKAGMQADRNCDVYFEDVRVPKENRVGDGPKGGKEYEIFHANLAIARIGSAAMALGNAQATFEIVLNYTKDRIVAGKPIREHSICAGMLADMAIGIETARAYMMNAAYMFDHPEKYGKQSSAQQLSRCSLAKVYATEVAIMVTNKAMELMGSYGYMHDYDVEKYWRDCKEIQLWEGGAQVGRFDVVRGYYDYAMKQE